MTPVDIDFFLNDDKVKELIYNTKTGTIISHLEFGIDDLCPQLLLNNDSLLLEEETITIRKNPASHAVITVVNKDIYEEIDWYCGSSVPLTLGVRDNGAVFTVSTVNAPFKNAGLYMVTVIGHATEEQKYYGTIFHIKVES